MYNKKVTNLQCLTVFKEGKYQTSVAESTVIVSGRLWHFTCLHWNANAQPQCRHFVVLSALLAIILISGISEIVLLSNATSGMQRGLPVATWRWRELSRFHRLFDHQPYSKAWAMITRLSACAHTPTHTDFFWYLRRQAVCLKGIEKLPNSPGLNNILVSPCSEHANSSCNSAKGVTATALGM